MALDNFARRVFRYFVEHQEYLHESPTVREVMNGVRSGSFKQVVDALTRLEHAGLIYRIERKHRNLRLTDEGERLADQIRRFVMREVMRFQIAQVRAGARHQEWQELLSNEGGDLWFDRDDRDTIEIIRSDLPARIEDLFALCVNGDSMIDAFIQQGDVIIVRRLAALDELRNGMMVIARNVADEGVTLKYFYNAGEYIELVPANPNYPVQRIPKRDAAILGVVVQVYRKDPTRKLVLTPSYIPNSRSAPSSTSTARQ